MSNPVWTGIELEVKLFRVINEIPYSVDGMPQGSLNGYRFNPQYDTPLLEYCFWQSASISASIETEQVQVPGRNSKRNISGGSSYTCSISSFYCEAKELDEGIVFNSRFRYHVAIIHTTFTSQRNVYQEQCVLFLASVSSFRLNGIENGISSYEVEYSAEDYQVYTVN